MNEQEIKYKKAKGRVKAIKGFYIHLIVYIVVNLLLFSINMITSPAELWFFRPLLGWGIGLGAHALSVFGFSVALGSNWEEKKIDELMEKD